MRIFDRHPRLRWAVPGAAAAVILAGAAVGTAGVSADSGLPAKTAGELLVDLQGATPQAMSGTVSYLADLGIPALPTGTSGGSSDLTSLASGTHTLRVWTDGAGKSRVDLLGERSEYDVIQNGKDVWVWDSSAVSAQHAVLTKDGAHEADTTAMQVPSTPQEAADLVLANLDPTTEVSVSGAGSVAGRPVYDLVLAPRQSGSKVARVVLSVDSETATPLRVQVFSSATQAPALYVGFTSVDFGTPDASVFDFTPPANATVTEMGGPDGSAGEAPQSNTAPPTVVGDGWTRVLVAAMPRPATAAASDASSGSQDLMTMLDSLPTVSGSWGSGHVLDGTLFTAILTDDGRIAVGAVTAQQVESALAAG
ncbi:MAG: hypothetical protein GC156_02580 [Actinomycetales bacterium]|nr:hypothetical protein [Actinomycetales bacterium]